ncbi:MAG: trehalose utilization protein [Planctomycetaceae bacterium]|nr:trehalose utilization protein [Planctomycetaceae bacterium]|tara:strand:+ start:65 stop:997 length:933 start_codon:yes stop_codon:yes gene_type:complete
MNRLFALVALVVWGVMVTVVGARQSQAAGPVRVVVWDERQPRQKQAYPEFLGNQIARALSARPGLTVRSVALDDAGQGISDKVLESCDVLIWWGHVRQGLIKPDAGQRIVRRIRSGKLSLIALHSAHWSTPFVEAMNARSRDDALAQVPEKFRSQAKIKLLSPVPPLYRAPKRSSALTPAATFFRNKDGRYEVNLRLPNCCFPAYRPDGKPSTITTRVPSHPIARGVPKVWTVAHTEMYDEPFHVPAPDVVVFEERWEAGERFRSGMVWNIGKGKVFYFRPGHETYGVYFEPTPLKVLENASRWLGGQLP